MITAAECLADTSTEWGSSRYGEWRRCEMGHHLRYHLGVMPAPRRIRTDAEIAADFLSDEAEGDAGDSEAEDSPAYFAIGQLVHAGQRLVREGVIAGQPQDWREVIDVASASGVYADEALIEAYRLLGAYFAHYGPDNGGFPDSVEILGCEVFWGVPAGVLGPLPYTARADCVVRQGGRILITDTKTRKASFPQKGRAKYLKGLAARPQFMGLSWLGWRELGSEAPPAIWVDGIIKTKIPKFERLILEMTPAALGRWEHAQRWDAWAMHSMRPEATTSPRCNLSACAPDFGSQCWAFDWCHGSEELRRRRFTTTGREPQKEVTI